MKTLPDIAIDGVINIHPVTAQTLKEFVKRVKEYGKDNLSKVVLFGSVARGEANKDSDIDVLVILKDFPRERRTDVIHISSDVNEYMDYDENAYLQVIPISEEDANGIYFFELMENIEREGVVLYDVR